MKKYIYPLSAIVIFFTMIMLNACKHDHHIVKYKGKYICISLSRYIDELSKEAASGSSVAPDLDTLFGMSWIDGYVIDNKNKDIILVGEQKKGWPAYHSEDIIINYQNVFDGGTAPYCSLDPYPENTLKLQHYMAEKTDNYEALIKNCQEAIGGQKVVTGGVPSNSRTAKIMIYADYDMKKISQGLLKVPGISSTIDLSVADSTNSSASASMSRFWLHIKEEENDTTYPNYNENEGIVFINECPVVVLTEKQYADSQGNLNDNHAEKDPIAMSFAAGMSKRYETLAAKNILFAELENMFRLQACLKAMQYKDAIDSSGINLSRISGLKLAKGNELPATLPGLINYQILRKNSHAENEERIDTRFFIVAGGVSQEMKINNENLYADMDKLFRKTGSVIINARPNSKPIYWFADINN